MAFNINSTLLPTTQIYDPSEIMELDVNSEDFKEFIVQLSQTQQDLLVNANLKPGGNYPKTPFLTGNLWYPNPTDTSNTQRTSIRIAVDTGQLPNNGVKAVAHDIPGVDATFTWVVIGGAATDSTGLTGISIPTVNATGRVAVQVTATQVIITTNANFSNYDRSQVYIEFILG